MMPPCPTVELNLDSQRLPRRATRSPAALIRSETNLDATLNYTETTEMCPDSADTELLGQLLLIHRRQNVSE
jgi:hypothetical protein